MNLPLLSYELAMDERMNPYSGPYMTHYCNSMFFSIPSFPANQRQVIRACGAGPAAEHMSKRAQGLGFREPMSNKMTNANRLALPLAVFPGKQKVYTDFSSNRTIGVQEV